MKELWLSNEGICPEELLHKLNVKLTTSIFGSSLEVNRRNKDKRKNVTQWILVYLHLIYAYKPMCNLKV